MLVVVAFEEKFPKRSSIHLLYYFISIMSRMDEPVLKTEVEEGLAVELSSIRDLKRDAPNHDGTARANNVVKRQRMNESINSLQLLSVGGGGTSAFAQRTASRSPGKVDACECTLA